jgi:hypothetical protein
MILRVVLLTVRLLERVLYEGTIFRFPELEKKFTTVCWGNTALKLYNFIERTSLGRLLSISFSF